MSKEIKFRCWNNCLRKYIPEDELMDSFGEYLKEKHLYIEQYTGLKDKNGKEIYEGDIVKFKGVSIPFMIEYSEPCTKFWAKCKSGLVEEFEDWGEEEVEIIGNIHENSELLGGEE